VGNALLALPFGLAVGVLLGLVGGGGSILTVPVLVYVLCEPVKQATTESLLIVGLTALVGACVAARRRQVDLRIGVAFAAAGAVTAVAGTALNRIATPRAVLLAFGLLLLPAAAAMARKREPAQQRPAADRSLRRDRVVVAGAATGVLTGFFGVGGGFAIVPALALVVGLPMRLAVGTSLLVIALTSAAAFAAHLASGGIDPALALAFTGAAAAGTLVGGRVQGRIPEAALRQSFAALLVVVAAFVIGQNVA
jgi:uncharacterized membrane protein YfcA